MPFPENLDIDKLSEAALAILSLSRFLVAGHTRVWKSIDWELTGMLFEKGWISDPVGKQKSVFLTDEGCKLAEKFLEKHFGK